MENEKVGCISLHRVFHSGTNCYASNGSLEHRIIDNSGNIDRNFFKLYKKNELTIYGCCGYQDISPYRVEGN